MKLSVRDVDPDGTVDAERAHTQRGRRRLRWIIKRRRTERNWKLCVLSSGQSFEECIVNASSRATAPPPPAAAIAMLCSFLQLRAGRRRSGVVAPRRKRGWQWWVGRAGRPVTASKRLPDL